MPENTQSRSVTDLDAMLAQIAVDKSRRETELHDAFRYPDALSSLIHRDSANLIAGVGGYAAPQDPAKREQWITENMHHDSFFVMQVSAVENLIREYVDAAMRRDR